MSKINYIIGESNTEKSRTKIALILADELANQKTLIEVRIIVVEARIIIVEARIVVLEALPNPTPEEEAELVLLQAELVLLQAELIELNLTLLSIPSRVYEERFIRPSEGEFPVLNVVLVSNPLQDLTGTEQQTDMAKFNIEGYFSAKSKSISDGDTSSSFGLQRLLMLCRHIMMYADYYVLGFEPGFIGSVSASDLQIAQPDGGADNGYLINGQITVNVKIKETQNKLEGIPLLESGTSHQLYESGKGYYYEIINT